MACGQGPGHSPGTVHSAYCGSQPSSLGPQPRVPSGAESSCRGITPSHSEWSQPQGQPPSASLGFVPLAVRDIEHSPGAACPLGRFPPPVCQEMAFKSNSFADLPSPKTPRNGENRSSQSRVLTDPHQSRPPEGNLGRSVTGCDKGLRVLLETECLGLGFQERLHISLIRFREKELLLDIFAGHGQNL